MKKLYSLILLFTGILTVSAQESAPAFPGAEGFARYTTTGGRGKTVVHVTNLNDSGTGSFRAAVSSAGRTVVFDVSGVIELKSDITFKDNLTILGQTAPGEGITLRYRTIRPGANNIIRFIRFRRGQEMDVNEGADATWQRQKSNIILDHCSFSWSIDEVASFYDNKNFTMQWCNVAEALNNAGHGKGAHGYGGIWGGKGASFHHNLIAHVNNRAPRLNGARFGWNGSAADNYESCIKAEQVDLRNCVMYNWGNGNGAYGGMGGYHNIVNNYYKAGPSTVNKTRVFQCSTTNSTDGTGTKAADYPAGVWGHFFIEGNYVTAASNPENYDWSGVIIDNCKDAGIKTPTQDEIKLTEPIYAGEVTTHDAVTAFEKVVSYAGASLYRDMVDVRHENEARTATATYTGSVSGMKGQLDIVADQGEYYISTQGETRPDNFDTDGDGIPDVWETANGLDPNDKSDGNKYTIDTKGFYTNIEVYANSLVEHIVKAQNADALTAVEEYYPQCVSYVDGIRGAETPASAVLRIEYYTLGGAKLEQPAKGICLRKMILTNGKTYTDKVIRH